MQRIKRFISALLALCLVFGQLPAVFATETAAVREDSTVQPLASSGTCGANLTWTLSDDGVLTISGTGCMVDYSTPGDVPWFKNCASITTVVISEGVTTIGDWAFYGCDGLTSVTIPAGVTTIGCEAFARCRGLTSVSIPGSVTRIGNSAFDYCDKLTSVTIPNGVITIENEAFTACNGLVSVTIPASVTTIGDGAFSGCYNLTGIYVDGSNPNYSSDSRGIVFNKAKTTLVVMPGGITGTYTTPAGVTTIGNFAFAGSCLTSVTIGDSVTTIGTSAFDSARLSSVTISDGVITIGPYAFSGCERLTSVTIPDSVTTLGEYAFYWCCGLTSAVIGDGVTMINDATFSWCYNMSSIEIGNGVTAIGAGAFHECGQLKNVTIPDSVITIGNGAFSPSGLSSVVIGNSVTTIGDAAFGSCKLTSVTIPASVTSIGDSAFVYSGLKKIEFCGNAPSFGSNTFEDVVATAYYPGSNSTWTSELRQNYGGSITWVPYSPYSDITTSILTRDEEDQGSDAAPVLIYPLELHSAWTLNTTLSDVAFTSALGTVVPAPGGYMLDYADAVAQDIVLSKADYWDYVLPAAVTETFVNEQNVAYSFAAYMQKDRKDGKPYISTVFGRVHGSGDPYTDLRVTELVAENDEEQDVIITACGFGDQEVTYYLAQDSMHEISNQTGVFDSTILYTVFDDVSTVYAYAVGADGTMTTPMELKLRRADYDEELPEFVMDSEFALLGKDFLKIKISEDIPLLGGAEIDLSAFTCPMGVWIEGNEVRVSLGLDLFGSTEDEDGYKWKTFKDLVIVDSAQIESDYKALETFCNVNGLANGKSWSDTSTANKFNINMLGYIEAKWVNGDLIIKEGLLSLGGKFVFEYVAQAAVWGVPVYGSIAAGAGVSVSGKTTRYLPDRTIPFHFNMVLDVEPEVKGGAGAGVKGAIAGGIYAKGTLPVMVEFQDEHLTMGLTGEVGVEGELFLLQGNIPLLSGDTMLADWYYGTDSVNAAGGSMQNAAATVTNIMSRDYADATSRWLGGDGASLLGLNAVSTNSVAARGVTFRDLQTSIFSNSQPQLAVCGDQMILVWVEDDTDRDTYNRMRLVFSVYDPSSDSWSDPASVWDDGHNDGYPRVASDGENVYVLWQKVNTTLNAENTSDIDTAMENAELCLARFDAQTGTFAGQQMLTSNSLYEYGHNVILNNGSPVAYWAAAADNAVSNAGCQTLYRWESGIAETIDQELNYILSIDAAGSKVTYVMDADGDLSTTADITAFTMSDSGTSAFDNSAMGTAVTYAGYAPLDGEQMLFLSDLSNIYYQQDGEIKAVFANDRAIGGNLNIVQTALGTTIVWTETVEEWNELYAVRYEDGSWTEPVMISDNGELLSRVAAVSYDGKLIGICNANAMIYDETTGEYTKDATDLSFFRVNDFTDISLGSCMNLNENELETGADTQLYVTVYNNGTTDVSELTFTLTDTLGTETVQTEAVELPAGGSKTVNLTYSVPEGYSSATVTITAETVEADADDSDNAVSVRIGNHDLSVTETSVEMLSGGYLLKAIVENGSLVDAENVVLSIFADDEESNALQSVPVGTIARENYALAEIMLAEKGLTFDENGVGKVYLKLSADGNEAAVADNQICVIVTEAVETTCNHPMAESVDAVAATCTEAGHNAYEFCVACGEYTIEYEEIAALGHSYKRGSCTVCGEADPDYTVTEIANGWSGSTTWVLTDDGVITFSGTGNMRNYDYDGGQPWEAYFDQITTVIIEDGITAVGSGAFRNMTKLESVTLPATGLNKIGEAAFYGCTSLKEIYIPDGVYTIWEYTFKNCTSLTSIRLPATLVKVDQGAFEACTALAELFIPGDTEIIGAWSFKGCSALTAVDMTWVNATEIRDGAFKNCTALTDVVLPADIQVLGDSAFYGIGAESFTIPATVTEVGPWCFARAALTEVTFEGNAPTIGEGAFNKITLTAYYPGSNATWTADVMQNYGGTVTWKVR